MSRQTKERTATFRIVAEDGRTFTVHRYTTFTDVGDGERVEGWKELVTSDGQPVNLKADGGYEIVGRIPIRARKIE